MVIIYYYYMHNIRLNEGVQHVDSLKITLSLYLILLWNGIISLIKKIRLDKTRLVTNQWLTYFLHNYILIYYIILRCYVVPGLTIKDAVQVSCNDSGWDIHVNLTRLGQASPGARASDIFLGENACTGTERQGVLYFQRGLDECLTTKSVSVFIVHCC